MAKALALYYIKLSTLTALYCPNVDVKVKVALLYSTKCNQTQCCGGGAVVVWWWCGIFWLEYPTILNCIGLNWTGLWQQVSSILEFGVPVWNSKLTQEEITDIERVKKSLMHITIGDEYTDYKSALYVTNLEMLSRRRSKLCLNFSTKSLKPNIVTSL